MKKHKEPYEVCMDVAKFAIKYINKADNRVTMRCLLEGCRYGIGLKGEKPKDNCIYCGRPRSTDMPIFE